MRPSITQLYSGGLRPFPGIPAEWPEAKRSGAAEILVDVERALGEPIPDADPRADIEDFWEDASRVSAAWRASGQNLEIKATGSESAPWSTEELARRLGPVGRAEEGGHHGTDRYIDHPIVREHGGRAMMLGSIDGKPGTCVLEWLAARHRGHGVKRGVVKAAATKNGIWSIELDSDPAVISQRLVEVMDWSYMRLEGGTADVFAQDAIDLQWEYRLFVVDGVVVSGAGCVEEFTPLDRDHQLPFDSRVRRIRGHLHQGAASEIEDRPAIVRQLIEFGERVAAQHGGTFGLDVALDAGAVSLGNPLGTPVVIEMNSISNSGLYASDPWAVAKVLVDAKDRGYQLWVPPLATPVSIVN